MTFRLIVLSLVLVLLALACGAGESEYVARNKAIIETLPAFPGARQVGSENSPYRQTESGPITGYGTRTTYQVPAGTTEEDVATFYRENVDASWRQNVQETPVIDLLTGRQLAPTRQYHFCRANEFVGVDALNVPGNGRYDVYVDHDYGQAGTRVMPCP